MFYKSGYIEDSYVYTIIGEVHDCTLTLESRKKGSTWKATYVEHLTLDRAMKKIQEIENILMIKHFEDEF